MTKVSYLDYGRVNKAYTVQINGTGGISDKSELLGLWKS